MSAIQAQPKHSSHHGVVVTADVIAILALTGAAVLAVVVAHHGNPWLYFGALASAVAALFVAQYTPWKSER